MGSLAVRHDNKAGVWYVDGVLHADLDLSEQALMGSIVSHSDIRSPVTVQKTQVGSRSFYSTHGTRSIRVVGALISSKSGSRILSLEQKLEAVNNNTLVGDSLQVTDGWLLSESTSSASS